MKHFWDLKVGDELAKVENNWAKSCTYESWWLYFKCIVHQSSSLQHATIRKSQSGFSEVTHFLFIETEISFLPLSKSEGKKTHRKQWKQSTVYVTQLKTGSQSAASRCRIIVTNEMKPQLASIVFPELANIETVEGKKNKQIVWQNICLKGMFLHIICCHMMQACICTWIKSCHENIIHVTDLSGYFFNMPGTHSLDILIFCCHINISFGFSLDWVLRIEPSWRHPSHALCDPFVLYLWDKIKLGFPNVRGSVIVACRWRSSMLALIHHGHDKHDNSKKKRASGVTESCFQPQEQGSKFSSGIIAHVEHPPC